MLSNPARKPASSRPFLAPLGSAARNNHARQDLLAKVQEQQEYVFGKRKPATSIEWALHSAEILVHWDFMVAINSRQWTNLRVTLCINMLWPGGVKKDTLLYRIRTQSKKRDDVDRVTRTYTDLIAAEREAGFTLGLYKENETYATVAPRR